MKRRLILKLGQEVKLTILDHCLVKGSVADGPMVFDVRGIVTDINKLHVCVAAWTDHFDPLKQDHANVESFTVLKKAIVGVKVMKYV